MAYEITSGDEMRCEIRRACADIGKEPEFLAAIRTVAKKTGSAVICIDADRVAGEAHVRAALFHAIRSFYIERTPVANSFEMETLLWTGATRQCTDATSFGIHPGRCRLFVVICPASAAATDALAQIVTFDDGDPSRWEELGPDKRARLRGFFGITAEEETALGGDRFAELVIERVALLEVYR
jgi:KEOPS complex subunit Cgi121